MFTPIFFSLASKWWVQLTQQVIYFQTHKRFRYFISFTLPAFKEDSQNCFAFKDTFLMCFAFQISFEHANTMRHKKWAHPVDCSLSKQCGEKRREVYRIYLLMQTNNNFSSNHFKEKAHTCFMCASEYNRSFITIFRRLSLQSFQQYFPLALEKSMKFIIPATSSEIYLFCTFYLLFFFPLFFRFSFFRLLNFKWMNTQEGSDPTYFYPLLHRCASIEIFQFSSFSQICLFSIFIFASFHAQQIFISFFQRWFSSFNSVSVFFLYY